jgi:hypothetical protein
MSIPPVPPSNPDAPEPGDQQAPRYGQNTPQPGQQPPSAPQYGQQAPSAPQYGQAPSAPQYGQQAPQYGQQAPQYGQNQPGYNQPQYNQPGQQASQFGQPAYGQSPYANYPSGQPQAAGMPKSVNTAFWLIVASGVVWIISLLMALGTLDSPQMRSMFEQQMAASGADIPYEDIRGVLVGSILVFALISAGLYALVALNVRKGKNWARILGTVFAALSIFSIFPLSLGTLAVLLGIAGIVMLYLPASSPYFSKQQPFTNPYGQPGGQY